MSLFEVSGKSKVKIPITDSHCRSGSCRQGGAFIVEDKCPPICHELFYSMVCVLRNGALLNYNNEKACCFDAVCPDHGRVAVHGKVIEGDDT